MIHARDLDENATIWKTGTLAEVQAFAAATHWVGVCAVFSDGVTYAWASKPVALKRGDLIEFPSWETRT